MITKGIDPKLFSSKAVDDETAEFNTNVEKLFADAPPPSEINIDEAREAFKVSHPPCGPWLG